MIEPSPRTDAARGIYGYEDAVSASFAAQLEAELETAIKEKNEEKNRADFAWKNTHEIDKQREKDRAKLITRGIKLENLRKAAEAYLVHGEVGGQTTDEILTARLALRGAIDAANP